MAVAVGSRYTERLAVVGSGVAMMAGYGLLLGPCLLPPVLGRCLGSGAIVAVKRCFADDHFPTTMTAFFRRILGSTHHTPKKIRVQ